ncbi:MAG TPA: polysaccharide biosynthesis tyrosine autokinase [Geminicoccaceae bacterium]
MPPALQREAGEGITLREIFAMLRRRLPLIIVVAAVGTVLATLAGHHVEREYTATAAVVIDPLDGQLVQIPGAAEAPAAVSPEVLETQIALITSRTHLEPVMRDLGRLEPEASPVEPPAPAPEPELVAGPGGVAGFLLGLPEPLRQLAAYVPETWLVAAGLAQDAAPVDAAAVAPSEPDTARRALVDRFRSGLEVRRAAHAYVITISYTDPDPVAAAEVANAVAGSYVQTQLDQRRAQAGQAADWLGERVEELREAVAAAEQAVADYRASLGVYGPAGRTFNEQKLVEVNRQLIALRAEQVAMEARLRRARDSRGGGSFDALAETLDTNFIGTLRSQEAQLLRQQAELAQTYGQRHPTMVNVRVQIDEVRAKIRQEIDRAIRNLEDEVAVLAHRESTLAADLARLERDQGAVQQDELRLRELEREAEATRQHYQALLRRFKDTQERESVLLPDARIISQAVPPEQPSTPGPRVFAMIGFTLSSAFGGFLALVLERLNRRVRSAAALEQSLGVPVLGLMPRLPNRRARRNVARYMVERPMSEFAESGRSLLMGLQLSPEGYRSPAVLITSALPEEGKSTLSLALAVAAASSGFKVLLIDLDLRRPALSQRLSGGRRGVGGLVDHVEGDLTLEELVQHEARTGIDFIVAGRPTPRPLIVLQSPELRHLIETARKAYDFVILDSAPLLAVAEARTAARLADRVILAARWRRTDTEAVSHAVYVLLQMQAELAGCVLTDVRMSKYKLYASDGGSYYSRNRRYYTN